MPSTWLHWRALAVLGALLFVCCTAARPINLIDDQNDELKLNVSGKSEYFIKEIVLKNNNNKNKSNMGHQVSTLSSSELHQFDKINLDKNFYAVSYANITSSTTTTTTQSSSSSSEWTFTTLFTTTQKYKENFFKGATIKNSVNSNVSINDNVLLSRADRSIHHTPGSNFTGKRSTKRQRDLERNERSANLSHITGATRKIQLYIKNRFLQILPDGTVNGTHDDTSDYTILHRTSVDIGQIKIQSVATCLFLCMDPCGTVYGSTTFSEDCVFNESMEQHHFNTYSSTHHSNARRTLYLALNRHGQPRKIQIPPTRPLGKLATYTKSLTQTVEQSRVDHLIAQNFGSNYIKHGLKQLCDSGQQLRPLTDNTLKPKPKCSLQNKIKKQVTKKKKRRKCRDDEPEGDNCFKAVVNSPTSVSGGPGNGPQKKRQQQQQQLQAQKQKCTNNNNEEDCVNNNLGNNNNNKKRPITKKMQNRPQQGGASGQKRGKQQHIVEIAAIHKLQPNNSRNTGRRNGRTTTTTTTTTTPKPSFTESLDDHSQEDEEEYEDILIDPHGHNMQFVDDDQHED